MRCLLSTRYGVIFLPVHSSRHKKFRDGVGNFTLDSGVTVKTTTGDIDIAGIEIIENGTLNASGDVIQNGIITQLNASDQSDLDSATDSTFVDNFLGPGVGC